MRIASPFPHPSFTEPKAAVIDTILPKPPHEWEIMAEAQRQKEKYPIWM